MPHRPRAGITGAMIVLFIAALAAGACAGPAKVELVLHTWMGDQDAHYFAEVFKRFEAEHPGVQVTHIYGGNYWERWRSMLAAGVPADLFFSTAFDFPQVLEAGAARPLNELIARDRIDLRDFYPPSIEQYRHEGKLYGLPYDFGNRPVVYNVNLFNEVGLAPLPTDWNSLGWTFQDAAVAARRLTLVDAGGATKRWGFIFPAGDVGRGLSPWFYSNGVSLIKRTPAGLASGFEDPAAVEVLTFLHEQLVTRQVMKQASWNPAFSKGEAAISQVIPAAVLNLQQSIAGFEWDVAPWPAGRAGHRTSGGGTGWFLSSPTKHLELAWKLYKLVTSAEAHRGHMEQGMLGVARRSVANSPAYLRTNPPAHMLVFAQANNFIALEPPTPLWPDYSRIVSAVWTAMMSGQKGPAAAAAEIAQRGTAILRGQVE